MRNDFCSNYLAHSFLAHHGILGMKWGIRRYQNKDGSLTDAGRSRYGVGEGKGVSDISTAKGYNRRIKDVKKAIKKNEKARGKQYSKIANNPENFMGLNKKHGKKIEEHSENIRKGEEELQKLFDKAKADGYDVKRGKVGEKKEIKPEITFSEQQLQSIGKEVRSSILKSEKDVQAYRKAFSDWDKTNNDWYSSDFNGKTEAQREKVKKQRYAAEEREQKIFQQLKDDAYDRLDKEYGDSINDYKKRELADSIAERAVYDIWDEEIKKNRATAKS